MTAPKPVHPQDGTERVSTARRSKRGGRKHRRDKPAEQAGRPIQNSISQATIEEILGSGRVRQHGELPLNMGEAGLFMMAANKGWAPDLGKAGELVMAGLLQLLAITPETDTKLRLNILIAISRQIQNWQNTLKDNFTAHVKMREHNTLLPGQEVEQKASELVIEQKGMSRDELVEEQLMTLEKTNAPIEQIDKFIELLRHMGYPLEED